MRRNFEFAPNVFFYRVPSFDHHQLITSIWFPFLVEMIPAGLVRPFTKLAISSKHGIQQETVLPIYTK